MRILGAGLGTGIGLVGTLDTNVGGLNLGSLML